MRPEAFAISPAALRRSSRCTFFLCFVGCSGVMGSFWPAIGPMRCSSPHHPRFWSATTGLWSIKNFQSWDACKFVHRADPFSLHICYSYFLTLTGTNRSGIGSLQLPPSSSYHPSQIIRPPFGETIPPAHVDSLPV